MKKNIVFGFIGVELDNMGKSASRLKKWRPTVSIFQHTHLTIHRMVLYYTDKKYRDLVELTIKDIQAISANSEIEAVLLPIKDPWDLEEVYSALYEYFTHFKFALNKEEYFIHISTGTHVIQISFYLLLEARYIPGKILQAVRPSKEMKQDQDLVKIIDLDLSKYDQIASRFRRQLNDEKEYLKYGINTRNKKINMMIEEIITVALRSDNPILLLGPTGSGKTRLARQIYNLKKKKNLIQGKFKELNCGALSRELAYPILFGHEKGSFTGADRKKEGLLIDADKGILFLDEIGDLSLEVQVMLLKAIEEKKFLPLGANDEVQSNFQLISGSNKDLYNEAENKRFREDLLARIDFWTFTLPSLSERREDIEPNIEFELMEFQAKKNFPISFNQEAKKNYLNFALSDSATWSHNFRDLNASIVRMASLAPGGRIDQKIVELEIERLKKNWHRLSIDIPEDKAILYKYFSPEQIKNIDIFERTQLGSVLEICRNSASLADAGRKLFSASRDKRKKTK